MRLENRLLEARRSAELSQEGLALRADVAIATIAKIETSTDYTPSGKTMLKLAGALNTTVQDLFWSEPVAVEDEREPVEAAS